MVPQSYNGEIHHIVFCRAKQTLQDVLNKNGEFTAEDQNRVRGDLVKLSGYSIRSDAANV